MPVTLGELLLTLKEHGFTKVQQDGIIFTISAYLNYLKGPDLDRSVVTRNIYPSIDIYDAGSGEFLARCVCAEKEERQVNLRGYAKDLQKKGEEGVKALAETVKSLIVRMGYTEVNLAGFAGLLGLSEELVEQAFRNLVTEGFLVETDTPQNGLWSKAYKVA